MNFYEPIKIEYGVLSPKRCKNRRRSSSCLEKFRCQIFYTTPEARRLWCLKIFASRTIYVVTCSERRESYLYGNQFDIL